MTRSTATTLITLLLAAAFFCVVATACAYVLTVGRECRTAQLPAHCAQDGNGTYCIGKGRNA